MNKRETFKVVINKNLVHVQVYFLKADLVHVKFTQYERYLSQSLNCIIY